VKTGEQREREGERGREGKAKREGERERERPKEREREKGGRCMIMMFTLSQCFDSLDLSD
jgi:hypothetical protein